MCAVTGVGTAEAVDAPAALLAVEAVATLAAGFAAVAALLAVVAPPLVVAVAVVPVPHAASSGATDRPAANAPQRRSRIRRDRVLDGVRNANVATS